MWKDSQKTIWLCHQTLYVLKSEKEEEEINHDRGSIEISLIYQQNGKKNQLKKYFVKSWLQSALKFFVLNAECDLICLSVVFKNSFHNIDPLQEI